MWEHPPQKKLWDQKDAGQIAEEKGLPHVEEHTRETDQQWEALQDLAKQQLFPDPAAEEVAKEEEVVQDDEPSRTEVTDWQQEVDESGLAEAATEPSSLRELANEELDEHVDRTALWEERTRKAVEDLCGISRVQESNHAQEMRQAAQQEQQRDQTLQQEL